MSGGEAEPYACECGSVRVRIPGIPETPCLACAAHERLWSCEYFEGTAFDTLLLEAGRSHGPKLLSIAWDLALIDVATLVRNLGPVWCDTEYPDLALEWDVWKSMFVKVGYTFDGKSADRPTEPLTLYRAAPASHQLGHSWSDDRGVAEKFMDLRRFHGPTLWRAKVEPRRLLARLEMDRPEEPSYVVDTDELDVERVELDA